MGKSVVIRGNHNIKFLDRGLESLSIEISQRLKAINFDNVHFLNSGFLSNIENSKNEIDFIIRDNDEYYNFQKNRCIDISGKDPDDGPHIWIDKYQIGFLFGFRYSEWCQENSRDVQEWRDKWIRFLQQTISAVGGNKVIYLADNGHPLEAFDYSAPLDEIELALKTRFGEPASSLYEAYESFSYQDSNSMGKYYIEYFNDLK